MKKITKTLITVLILLISYSILAKTYAASASISASKTSVTVGESITISVSMNAAAWNTNVSGAVTKNFAGNSDDGENINKVENITFTPSSAGAYTFNLGGDVSDGSTNATTNVSGSVTVNVSDGQPQNDSGSTSTEKQEPNFSSTSQKMYTTGNINLRSSWSTSSAAVSVPAGTEVTVTATSTNKVNGYVWYKISYNGQTKYVASGLLTSKKTDNEDKKEDEKEDEKEAENKKENKESDNTLKALEVTPNGLSPKFSSSTEKYALSVNPDVEKLDIKATPTSDKAKVSITGNEDFKAGENTVKITVTAEDGKTKTYIITVKKQEKSKAIGLTSLTLDKYSLTPNFSTDVYEYNVSITDENIEKLDLSAIANVEGAKVEITGNENFKSGKNTITITVTSADGENKTVYKIYADIQTKKTNALTTTQPSSAQTTKSKLPLYIGVGLIAFLIIVMITIIIKNKRANEEYDDEYDDENEEDETKSSEKIDGDTDNDLYNFSSKNFELDDMNNNNAENQKYADKDVEHNDKDKLKEDYLNQFNYNPYSEDKMENINENKKEESYSDLFGTYKEQDDNTQISYSDEDEYDYNRPKKSKGKHSK